MKRRKSQLFSISTESLEIRDLKSADFVAWPSITPRGEYELRLVKITDLTPDTAVATNEDFSDPAPNSEDPPLSGEAANDAIRRRLVQEIQKGTTIELHSGRKFVFDSPTSGRLYLPDGTSRRFVDIDFTPGNRGWFSESGPWITAALFRYRGKHGFGHGVGDFLQADGNGFEEVYFGGREVNESDRSCSSADTSWIGNKYGTPEYTSDEGLFQAREKESPCVSAEAESDEDALVTTSDAKSRSAICGGEANSTDRIDRISCDPNHITLPLSVVPLPASDIYLTLVDDLFASEQLNWACGSLGGHREKTAVL